MNLWALDSPFDVIAVAGWWLLRALARWVLLISGNVGELGWGYVVAYWVAVLGLLQLGGWGFANTVVVRKGNDFIEFDPGRRSAKFWGLPFWVLGNQIKIRAYVVVGAELVGYGGALLLLAVGTFWRWWLLAGALWVASKAAAWRRGRVYARRFAVP